MMVTAGLLSFAVTSSAQRDSILFEENHTIDTTAIGELRVNIDNLNFFKNNEYESQITKGYTLPGFWVKPSVSYQPLRNLKVDVGAYMIHYWGATKYPIATCQNGTENNTRRDSTSCHFSECRLTRQKDLA